MSVVRGTKSVRGWDSVSRVLVRMWLAAGYARIVVEKFFHNATKALRSWCPTDESFADFN